MTGMTANLEGYELIASGRLLNLSEQELAAYLQLSMAEYEDLVESGDLSAEESQKIYGLLSEKLGAESLYHAVLMRFDRLGFSRGLDVEVDCASIRHREHALAITASADGIDLSDVDQGLQLPGIFALEDFEEFASLLEEVMNEESSTSAVVSAWKRRIGALAKFT